MKWFTVVLVALSVLSNTVSAEVKRKSAYNIDYKQHTFNEIIANFMYDIEPKLLEHYKKLNLPEDEIVWGLEGMAGALALNHVFSTIVKDIEAADPDATEVFTKLPKERYSKLHLLAELFRIKREYKEKFGVELTEEEGQKSLRLYKALFGKEYKAQKK